MKQESPDDPTKRRKRFVGPEEERSRAFRQILVGLWKFVRKRLVVPGMEGSISLWICQLHGIDRFSNAAKETEVRRQVARSQQLLSSFGPALDPNEMKAIQEHGQAIQHGSSFQVMIDAAKNLNPVEFNKSFEEAVGSLLAPFQPNLPLEDLSFKAMCQARRAVRATMVALAFHDAHPLTLIASSWKGDQSAALELVRVDKLFLHDPATEAVIRTAGFRNDHDFFNALAGAQKKEPRLYRRDLIHLYMCVLFMLEQIGKAMPRIDELQRLLDPSGTIYPGAYAFERDLQRRRESFLATLQEAESESATIYNFFRSSKSQS